MKKTFNFQRSNSSLSKQLSLLTFLVAFLLLSTHCQWAWGQKVPFKVIDRFGTEYSLSDITRPPDRQAFDCDGSGDGITQGEHFNFLLDFTDASGQGFNSAAFAPYKTVICQVLTDLSYLLDAHLDCAGNKPLLRIEIRPAIYEPPTPNGTLLGAASTYYYNYTNGTQMQTGYAYGNVWRTLNGGEDNTQMPYLIGNNIYHGYMYFNLHNSITWNTAMNPNFSNGAAGKDFYQVVLHETCHMLGIHSWIDSDGTSRVSNAASDPNGLYTAYDKFLLNASSPPPTGATIRLLDNTDGCHAVQFNTTTNLLTGGCDQVTFRGIQDYNLSLPAYTPTTWSDGSSLSHFGNDPCDTTPYLMHWSIMNDNLGHAIHRPTNDELRVLCEIGYRVTNTYGSPSSPFNATVTGCGHIAAGVDDSKPNLNNTGALSCTEPLYKFCSFPATINLNDLLANDVGVNVPATINNPCLSILQGNILWTTANGVATITINSASYGLNAFSYTPIDAITGQQLNTTVVYFEANTCLNNCNAANAVPCNLICNSSINPPTPSCIGNIYNCTVEGWLATSGSPDYWINETVSALGSNVIPITPYNTNPPTPGCMGMFTSATLASTGGESMGTPTSIANGQSYIYSSFAMNPNWSTPLNLTALLNNTPGFLTNGAQTILAQTSIPADDTWRQTISCFTATDNYSRLFIKPYGTSAKYLFVDEVHLSPDNFPAANNLLNAVTCGEQFTLGNTCTAIPNVLFKWETSTNGSNWTPIPGATAGTYTTPALSTVSCMYYRLTRYLNPTPTYPITNAAAVAACINKVATYQICASFEATSCCINTTQSTYLQFNSNNQVVPFGTGGTNNYTAPVATATITPTSSNNPFGIGVGTAANPVRINGDITIPSGANITLLGFTFEFGINGRIKVAANAQLTITGSTLRGNPNCQTMWQGIRVQGPGESNKRNLSGALNYGILQLTGVVNIEDAIIGAAGMYMPLIPPDVLLAQITQSQDLSTLSTLIMPAYTNNINAHQTSGGVVRVEGHVINFNNCFQGVNLSWYPYNGSSTTNSFVHQGNFIANRTLWYPFSQLPTAAGTISEVGVVLNYYNDLSINLSHFTNTLYGIRAFGAYKIVIGKDNIFERTNFANKTMVGISVFNFQNSPVVDADLIITQNHFNNLTIGMQCAGADLDINTNTINNIAGSGSYAGVLLYGCTYTAKSNNINHCYTGIASQSDQNIPNLIKANSFNNCLVPTWTRGDDTNLQIVCNDFDNYLTGICMSNATIVAPEPGKLDDQGSCNPNFGADKNPADNLFLSQANPSFPDLYSNTIDSYKYYYRTIGTDFQPTASANLEPILCPDEGESRADNCLDFVLSPNDVINIAEGTAQDQAMIATIRRLVQIDHDTTAAVNLLATVNSRAAKRMALEYYIKKAMWNAAQQVLNSLSVVTQDEQFFKQLYTIKRDLAQSNRSIFDITTTEEATITNIAAYRTRTSFEAQAILYLVRQIEYPILMEHLPAPLPAYTGVLPVVHFKNNATNQQLANGIKVFPNPANRIVSVFVPDEFATTQLSLYSIDGKTLLNQTLYAGTNTLYLQQMQAGLYYYLIQLDGNVIERNKLVLIK